jgi:endonuclease/exonuclease/phosphatase family metal-dependent hydrolase
MKKTTAVIVFFAILILFTIQMAGTLVESIYILDLMNSRLDAKILGVLFFFTPVLVLPFFRKSPQVLGWVLFGLLFVSRGLSAHLETAGRLAASGIAVGAAVALLLLALTGLGKTARPGQIGLWGSAGLALAVGLSALLRAAYSGLEYSLIPEGAWSGWLLGLGLGLALSQLSFDYEPDLEKKAPEVTAPILGIYLVLTLIYFAFSAPSVIARWTEGNYLLILAAVSLWSAGWAAVVIARPERIERISKRVLVAWNALFMLSLAGTLLAARVSFPKTLEQPAAVAGQPGLLQQLPLFLMLLLFPVVFLDMRLFMGGLAEARPRPAKLLPGILLGSFVLILLVFANIFSNVWGYVDPVSTPFRNTYWLTYTLMGAGLSLLAWRVKWTRVETEPAAWSWGWAAGLAALVLVSVVFAWPAQPVETAPNQATAEPRTSLVVMTFNTQQSNAEDGEKSYTEQLALIGRVSPDILALQESDSARISLNNNDYVRYFAENLGYYSYYGPTPAAGSYGTAILSKYPLKNTRTAFIYSDKDETGIAEAEIEVGGRTFTIYDVHPDSSEAAMMAFAKALLERSQGKSSVIALGDYNLRDYEEAYQLIDDVLTNAWTSVYPSEIGADGVDMSGENRIDHIFLSADLSARSPVYVLPPESATDHPVHWTEVTWEQP